MRRIFTRTPITIAILISVLFTVGTVMFIYQDNYIALAYPQGYGIENYTFGPISSIQNDENGEPAWVIMGNWKSNLVNDQSTSTDAEREGNVTTAASPSSFDAQMEMIRLDGTAGHTHTITNFVLSNTSQPNNMTNVFNGTSTASMREGPVTDIPTSIRIIGDKVISIWLDPSKIENHYGNTPIYGLIFDDRMNGPPGPPGPPKVDSMRTGNGSLR